MYIYCNGWQQQVDCTTPYHFIRSLCNHATCSDDIIIINTEAVQVVAQGGASLYDGSLQVYSHRECA
jgi:hypothetical protein